MILCNMEKTKWEIDKNRECWGEEALEKDGFLHCSTLDTFWRVVPKLINSKEDLVLIFIDESKLESEVRFEDLKNKGIDFPHIYGLVNREAVVDVSDFIRDEKGNWIRGKEFSNIVDR